MVVCGEASYSIYLLHMGIIQYAGTWDVLAKQPLPSTDAEGTIAVLVKE